MALVFIATWSLSAPAQSVVSLRNNLLWDATGTANLGIEIPVSDHWSVGLDAGFKSWPRFFVWDGDVVNNATHWRYFTLAPEVRYYPKLVQKGWFAGANAAYTHFNIGQIKPPFGLYADLQDHRWQGDLYTAALFGGYSWQLSRHLRLEVDAGVAAGYRKAARFECAHCGAQLGNSNGVTVLPKVGVSLAWNIGTRKQKKQEVIDIITVIERPDIKPVTDTTDITEKPDTLLPIIPPRPDSVIVITPKPKPQRPAILRPVEDYRPYYADTDLHRKEGIVPIWFEFSGYEIKRSVRIGGVQRDNGANLDSIIAITSRALADETIVPVKIQVVGFSSVDGGRWGNERLSLRRAEALKNYIQSFIDLPDGLFELVAGGEAWIELREELIDLLIEGGNDSFSPAELEKAIAIIDAYKDPVDRENQLRALNGGAFFRKLQRTLLADQRSAVLVRIYYEEVEQSILPTKR